jgi:hypothetical protein
MLVNINGYSVAILCMQLSLLHILQIMSLTMQVMQ